MTRGPELADPLVQQVIREDVRAMASYHVPASDGLVKLDAMENPHGLPADLAQALGDMLGRVALNRYPVPEYAALKEAIRSRMGVPEGFQVLLGNGSDELISMVLQATARPGAVVLSPWPSFVMYELSSRFVHSRFEPVPLAADFSLDLPAMLAAIRAHRPAVVFLAYPNNPTGNCFDDAAIAAILQAAPGLVVVDEAYQPFAGATWMDRLPQHPNLVVLRTVSKLGLAGIRLGYLAASAALLAEFDKVRPPYNINVLTEATALFVLDHIGVLQAQAAQLRAERSHLLSALRAQEGVTAFESRANFVLLRVQRAGLSKGASGPSVWRGLLEKKVLVKDVGKMHPLLADCLRVTVGTPDENAAFLRALKATLGG